MSLILQVTQAGREQKAAARLNGSALPPFTGIVVDSAETQDDDAPVISALYTSQPGDVFQVSMIDSQAFLIECGIPPTVPAGFVRGIGLTTADGVIYAYARYAAANNGMYKPAGMGIQLKLVLAEDGRDSVAFTFEFIDLEATRQQLQASLADQIQLALQAVIPGIIQQVLAQVSTGGGTGDVTCQQVYSILTQYASIENGELVFNCPESGTDPTNPGTDPTSLPNGSSVSFDPDTAILSINVAGDTAYTDGLLTLTDPVDGTETYQIENNVLTITET